MHATVLAVPVDGGLLVDTSRANVMPENALDAVLREGDRGPSHACVDVFALEGRRFDSPLAANPHTPLTPHMAGMTRSAMCAASTRLLEEFARFYASPLTAGTAPTVSRRCAPTSTNTAP